MLHNFSNYSTHVHVVDEVLLWDGDVSGSPSVGDPLPGLVDAAEGPALIQALQLNPDISSTTQNQKLCFKANFG